MNKLKFNERNQHLKHVYDLHKWVAPLAHLNVELEVGKYFLCLPLTGIYPSIIKVDALDTRRENHPTEGSFDGRKLKRSFLTNGETLEKYAVYIDVSAIVTESRKEWMENNRYVNVPENHLDLCGHEILEGDTIICTQHTWKHPSILKVQKSSKVTAVVLNGSKKVTVKKSESFNLSAFFRAYPELAL